MAQEDVNLVCIARDIHAQFPGAIVSWDTKTTPYLITVGLHGGRYRVFLEPGDMMTGTPVYERFIAGILSELRTIADRPGALREGMRDDPSPSDSPT
jgi:hypothetical protein